MTTRTSQQIRISMSPLKPSSASHADKMIKKMSLHTCCLPSAIILGVFTEQYLFLTPHCRLPILQHNPSPLMVAHVFFQFAGFSVS